MKNTSLQGLLMQLGRSFSKEQIALASGLLSDADFPMCGVNRDRIWCAILYMADGSYDKFLIYIEEAKKDWRDVLISAGLESANWRDVLAKRGIAI